MTWSDSYHGACLQRGQNRVASWTWAAAQPPVGLCLPVERSDLAEWRYNLGGEIKGLGSLNFQEVISHQERHFPGGFLTWGTTHFHSQRMSAEGQADEIIAEQKIVFVALPDDATTIILQKAVNLARRTYLASFKGLFLQIPNDLFNGNKRTYFGQRGETQLMGFGSQQELLDLQSSWLNIEDRLGLIGIYGAPSLSINRPGHRQLGLTPSFQRDNANTGGQLFADEICYPVKNGLHTHEPEAVIYDLAVLQQVGASHLETQKYAESGKCSSVFMHPQLRAIEARGVDGNKYLLLANLSRKAISIDEGKMPVGKGVDLVSDETVELAGLELSGESAIVLRLD